MTRLDTLSSRTFDLLIIGGGIHGAFAAWEAASRGLAVALVERDDFGAGASANSLKILHGGFRYLQHLDIVRLRESTAERARLMRLAPDLTSPLPCVMPLGGSLSPHAIALRGALIVHRALSSGGDAVRNGRVLGRQEYRRFAGAFAIPDARGGALWYDGLMNDPDRLLISIVLDAERMGAVVANYTEAVGLLRDAERVIGARVRTSDGGECEVNARIVLIAANAGARAIAPAASTDALPSFVCATNVIVRRDPPTAAVAFRARPSGRWFFAVPWRGHLMLGTTQRPPSPSAVDENVRELLEVANVAAPSLELTEHDVTLVHRGHLPGLPDALLDRPLLIDHAERDGAPGAITMIGVKWTTARRTAERAVDVAAEKLRAAGIAVRNAAPPRQLPSSRFGAQDEEDAGPMGDGEVSATEIVRAVRHEHARHLDDIVLRRTSLGTAGHPGEPALRTAAELAAAELGWSADETERELERVRSRFPTYGDRVAPQRGDPSFRARQLALFDASVLKRAKWREIERAIGDVAGLDAADLGADNGVISWLLRQRGGRWSSADLTEETVAAIRRMVGERVYRLEGPVLPFADASLDRIVVVDLLEHLEDDRRLLEEIARCLRPGGRAVLNVPREARGGVLPRLRHAIGLTDEWHGHRHSGYDAPRLRALLPPGLRLTSVREYSKSFSHALDTALNWAFVRQSRDRAQSTAKGMVVTGTSVSHGGASLLRRVYPAMRAFAALDALLPLARGYMLIVTLERS